MRLSPIFLFTLFTLFFNCQPSSDPQAGQATEVMEEATSRTVETETLDTIPTVFFSLDYLRGRFNPSQHEDFTKVASELTDGDGTYYLRKDASEAFAAMHQAAAAEGIRLEIVSATRNFDRQKSIWEAKWSGARLLEGREKAPDAYPNPKERALAILRWSSMPGTSRHHWGTDIDINQLTNEYFASGKGLKEYEWLTAHAHEYGFCQPYSPKGEGLRPHGYNEEKWHWSYLPIARQLTQLAATQLADEQIDGFQGAETAVQIGVVEKYVLGVSEACKPANDTPLSSLDKAHHQWISQLGSPELANSYTPEAISISAAANITEGPTSIAQHWQQELADSKIKSYRALARITVGKNNEYTYEISEFATQSQERFAQLTIWNNTDQQARRELEFIVPYDNPIAELKPIRATREQWMAHCNAHAVDQLIQNVYTANTLYYNHRPLLQGREDLIKEYAYMKRPEYQLTLTPVHIEPVSEQLVLEIGQCSGSYGGNYIIVWEKQEDGAWQVLLDANL